MTVRTAFAFVWLAIGGSVVADDHEKPSVIHKLGTIDLDMVETTPVVWRGEVWRFEWVRQGIGQQYWANERQTNYFRFRNRQSGAVTAPFADGHEFGSAYVEKQRATPHPGPLLERGGEGEEIACVTGTLGRSRIDLFVSSELKKWEQRTVLNDPRYGIFNTSMWKAGDEYVLAFEIDKPRDEAGTPFTIRFLKSRDLSTWTLTPPECNFTKERYSAAPCLRWSGGWYFLFYLEAHDGYETRVVRSRDLIRWEASPLNPVLRPSAEDKLIANPKLSPAQREKIAAAKNINNSDLDFCEWRGRLILNYSWGNQQGTEFLAEATYRGTQDQFLRAWFPRR